jgi:transposase-like protein
MKITNEEKKTHIELWKESGLTKTEYAREIGINRDIFYSWFRQVQIPKAAHQGFVQVGTNATNMERTAGDHYEAAKIIIELPNSPRVEVYPGFCPDTLLAVLSAMERR